MRFVALFLSLAAVAPAQQFEYEVRHVQGNVYMFASTLGNVTIQVGKDPGHDGVLLVDTGDPRLRETLLAEIRKLSMNRCGSSSTPAWTPATSDRTKCC